MKILCSWCSFSRTFFDILFPVSCLFSASRPYIETGYNYKFFETFHLFIFTDARIDSFLRSKVKLNWRLLVKKDISPFHKSV